MLVEINYSSPLFKRLLLFFRTKTSKEIWDEKRLSCEYFGASFWFQVKNLLQILKLMFFEKLTVFVARRTSGIGERSEKCRRFLTTWFALGVILWIIWMSLNGVSLIQTSRVRDLQDKLAIEHQLVLAKEFTYVNEPAFQQFLSQF